MYTSPYPAVDAAIESTNVTLGHQLFVDWNEDGAYTHAYSDLSKLVISAETNRTLEGSLPADATLIEGASAGELILLLGGKRDADELSAAQVFSPYNPKSPIYSRKLLGIPVQYTILVGSDEGSAGFRQFTGRIRAVKVDAETGWVSLTCLDASEDLQAPVTLPPHCAFEDPVMQHHLFNQHWVMDTILRSNGFYQTPPEHPDANYYASMKGGSATTKGWLWTFDAVKANRAPSGTEAPTAWAAWGHDDRVGMFPDVETGVWGFKWLGITSMRIPRPDHGNAVGGGFQFYGIPANSDLADPTVLYGYLNGNTQLDVNTGNQQFYETEENAWWRLYVRPSDIRIELRNRRGTADYWMRAVVPPEQYLPLLNEDGWNSVQGEFYFQSDRVTANLCINGQWFQMVQMGAFPAIDPGPLYPGTRYIEWPLSVSFESHLKTTDVQTYSTRTPMHMIFRPDFKQSAKLDYCLNYLTHTPVVVDENSWDVLREMANVEYGSLFVDEDGVVRYRNRKSSREMKTDVSRKLGEDQLQNLSIEAASESIRNVMTAESVSMYRTGAWGVWDAGSDSMLEEQTDEYTFQPGLSGFQVRDLDHVVYPFILGRNTITWHSPKNILWEDFESAQEGKSSKSPSIGLFAVQADSGHLQERGKVTVDLWPIDNRSFQVSVFVFSDANPVGQHAVQLSNYVIDKTGGKPPGGSVNQDEKDRFYPGIAGSGVEVRRYTLRIPAVTRKEANPKKSRVVNYGSVAKYGESVFNIDTTRWSQSHGSMNRLCADLLKEMAAPPPILGDVTVPGDPRIQLGDTLVISNPTVLGDYIYTGIAGITRSFTDEGLTDTYTLKILHRPGSWVLGHPDYSILRNEANKQEGTTIVQSAIY